MNGVETALVVAVAVLVAGVLWRFGQRQLALARRPDPPQVVGYETPQVVWLLEHADARHGFVLVAFASQEEVATATDILRRTGVEHRAGAVPVYATVADWMHDRG